MKNSTIYIITLILCLMFVGCGYINTDNSNSNTNQVVINLPFDDSVNGYRQNTTESYSNTNLPNTIKGEDVEINNATANDNSHASSINKDTSSIKNSSKENTTITSNKTESIASVDNNTTKEETYCGNKNSKIFHKLTCGSVSKMKNENKNYATRQELIDDGYKACERCQP